jgi:hypothetical protein
MGQQQPWFENHISKAQESLINVASTALPSPQQCIVVQVQKNSKPGLSPYNRPQIPKLGPEIDL